MQEKNAAVVQSEAQHHPNHSTVQYLAGVYFFNQQDYAEAQVYVNRSLMIDSDSYVAHRLLMLACFAGQDYVTSGTEAAFLLQRYPARLEEQKADIVIAHEMGIVQAINAAETNFAAIDVHIAALQKLEVDPADYLPAITGFIASVTLTSLNDQKPATQDLRIATEYLIQKGFELLPGVTRFYMIQALIYFNFGELDAFMRQVRQVAELGLLNEALQDEDQRGFIEHAVEQFSGAADPDIRGYGQELQALVTTASH